MASKPDWPAERFIAQDHCAYCDSARLEPFIGGVRDWYFKAVPGEFAFLRCADCRSLLLDRRIAPEHLEAAYADYYTHESEDRAGLARTVWQAIARGYARTKFGKDRGLGPVLCNLIVKALPARRERVDLNCRYLPSGAHQVLDFGCGNGAYLKRVEGLGISAKGVEFDSQAIAAANAQGLSVVHADAVDDAGWTESFDHITANHVLEHLPDPASQLATFQRWLKPSGTVFVELPNAEAGGIARNGQYWRGFEAPRHFSLPSRQGLTRIFERAGFTDIRFHKRDGLAQGMDAMADIIRKDAPEADLRPPASLDATGQEFLTVTARRPAA